MWFVNLASGGVYIAQLVTKLTVGSYPTFPSLPKNWRFISVALSLKSPPPGFLRHPVSKKLGLSSLTVSLRPRDRITNLKYHYCNTLLPFCQAKKKKDCLSKVVLFLRCFIYKFLFTNHLHLEREFPFRFRLKFLCKSQMRQTYF